MKNFLLIRALIQLDEKDFEKITMVTLQMRSKNTQEVIGFLERLKFNYMLSGMDKELFMKTVAEELKATKINKGGNRQ